MPTLFEYLDSINTTGINLMVDEASAKDYPPYMINRGMAQNIDTVLLANEMNKASALDKDLQYKFYLSATTKRKRYGKWSKKLEIAEDVALVAKIYDVSYDKAEEYVKLLTAEQLLALRASTDPGGQKKKGKNA